MALGEHNLLEVNGIEYYPLSEVSLGVYVDELSPVLPKLGERWGLWTDPGCTADSGACQQSHHCLHVIKESEQGNAKGLS